jgi:hypothetical protein
LDQRVILTPLRWSTLKPVEPPSSMLLWIWLIGTVALGHGQGMPKGGEVGIIEYMPRTEVSGRSIRLAWYVSEWVSFNSRFFFWSYALNAFLFGHGPMTPTLADVLLFTCLGISSSEILFSYHDAKPSHRLKTKNVGV